MRNVEAQVREYGFGLKVTAVPQHFRRVEEEMFDPENMPALYDGEYGLALDGDACQVLVHSWAER